MALEHGADLVLLAHHRRDQAETFVLQALRGGGVAALSAMPAVAQRDDITWARPWLAWPRDAIDAYVRRHRLRHVEDETNSDARYARNRLRSRVWPALTQAFPEAEASLAAAAQWAQQADATLRELALLDLATVDHEGCLDIKSWRLLSVARQGNSLRAWLRAQTGKAAPASLVERLLREVGDRRALHWPLPSGESRSYRGRLRVDVAVAPAGPQLPTTADLSREGTHHFPDWRGAVVVASVTSGGIEKTIAAKLELRPRAAGDTFQIAKSRPARSLKLQFQAAGVPPWQRFGPVICHRGATVFVPGLGIDARALAPPGHRQVGLRWQPA